MKVAAQGPAPPPGLKLVKSGAGLKLVKTGEPAQEGPRPKARPGTHAKRAQHASHVVVLVLIPIYVFTDLRLYRVGKFLKKLGAFYKKCCVVCVHERLIETFFTSSQKTLFRTYKQN